MFDSFLAPTAPIFTPSAKPYNPSAPDWVAPDVQDFVQQPYNNLSIVSVDRFECVYFVYNPLHFLVFGFFQFIRSSLNRELYINLSSWNIINPTHSTMGSLSRPESSRIIHFTHLPLRFS